MIKNDKITQKKAVFYILWKAHRENPEEYVDAWRFVGELEIPELGKSFFMSYKCPTNGLDIYFDNPGLIERRYKTGKSGAKYYQYRIAPNPSPEKIQEETLQSFYKILKFKANLQKEK